MTLLDQRYRSVHIVGAGGAGMSGLAKILAQAGVSVSGSDLKPSRSLSSLEDLGVDVWVGHHPDRAAGWDLVVASSAVPARDPELLAAERAGVEVIRRPHLLKMLTDRMPGIGLTGTHGKTTSTALAIAALRGLGRDPTFLVGGELAGLNTNAHLGETGLFVLEADEAFGTFLELRLRALAITNIEADHLDYYGTLRSLEDAFRTVAGHVDGPVVAAADDPGARALATDLATVKTFGFADDADWRVVGLQLEGERVSFTLLSEHGETPVTVPRPGSHVAIDAAGVLAMLGELGLDVEAAAAGLASFSGVRRRFEVRARINGVTVVDDYAHHPTEIAATLAAAGTDAWNRVWAIFQPHRYTRTADLHAEFGPALAAADRVVVTDVYSAGEQPEPGVSGRLVADAAQSAGAMVEYVPRRRDLADHLAGMVAEGDLVLLLGAGDISLVADELAGLLEAAR